MVKMYKIIVLAMLVSFVSASPNYNGTVIPCVKKLLTCWPYLKAPSTPPPPSCCVPLKAMLVFDDSSCLCALFNNLELLKSINMTQQDAKTLGKACSANANVYNCKNQKDVDTTEDYDDIPVAGVSTDSPITSSKGTSVSHNSTQTSSAAVNYGISIGACSVYFMLSSFTIPIILHFF